MSSELPISATYAVASSAPFIAISQEMPYKPLSTRRPKHKELIMHDGTPLPGSEEQNAQPRVVASHIADDIGDFSEPSVDSQMHADIGAILSTMVKEGKTDPAPTKHAGMAPTEDPTTIDPDALAELLAYCVRGASWMKMNRHRSKDTARADRSCDSAKPAEG